jgi:3-dehydroquinate synthase
MITVSAGAHRYEVIVNPGALDDVGALASDVGLQGRGLIVSDTNVAPLHGERALASLRAAGFDASLYAMPAGETAKTLDTVRGIYDWLCDQHAERSSTVFALGGGVVGDVAGFAAATYLRGVPFVQVPTSLLAMVDASIGGKVGVDHPRGKNLIGAFYPPRLVVDDPALLRSLPQRALRDGVAEAIKHALILDPPMLDVIGAEADRILSAEPEFTTEFVLRNVAIKAAVVGQDEREAERRMILNYGHTTAHALEAVTGYGKMMHGEADSIGMMVAAAIGEGMGITPVSVAKRQAELFVRYGLPLRYIGSKVDADAVRAAMSHDKKIASNRLRWVLLEDFGKPVIRDDVPDELVLNVVESLLS